MGTLVLLREILLLLSRYITLHVYKPDFLFSYLCLGVPSGSLRAEPPNDISDDIYGCILFIGQKGPSSYVLLRSL